VTFGERRAYAGKIFELNRLAFAGLLVDALVVDPGRLHGHGPRPDRHAPLARAAVTHDQPLAILVALAGEPLDILGDLDFQRRRDHPASTLPREIVKRDRDLVVVVLPDGEPANIHHGVPSCRPSPASVFINREGTPPCRRSGPSTTSGYISQTRARSPSTPVCATSC